MKTKILADFQMSISVPLTQWPSWNMMMSSKKAREFDYYFWKILCSTTLMQSFRARVLNCSGFVTGCLSLARKIYVRSMPNIELKSDCPLHLEETLRKSWKQANGILKTKMSVNKIQYLFLSWSVNQALGSRNYSMSKLSPRTSHSLGAIFLSTR